MEIEIFIKLLINRVFKKVFQDCLKDKEEKLTFLRNLAQILKIGPKFSPLWYDAFILEQAKYPNIINNYKILRKQNLIFPPRNSNEKSLIAVKTESPIFDNIEAIAESDKQKFKKKLRAMGMSNLSQKFQQREKVLKDMPIILTKKKQLNIDEISQKIAIIQSQNCEAPAALKIIDEVKYSMQHMKLKPNEQSYWKQVKGAAEELIEQWQKKNAKFIEQQQQKYLQSKINGQKNKNNQIITNNLHSKQPQNKQSQNQQPHKIQTIDLLSGDDDGNVQEIINNNAQNNKPEDQWTQFASFQNQNQNCDQNGNKTVQQTNLLEL